MNKYLMNTSTSVELSDKHFYKGNSFNNLQYLPCCARRLRKILLFYKKLVDSLKTYVVFLKYTKSVFGGKSWKYTLYIA
jgi:hypothetical protein